MKNFFSPLKFYLLYIAFLFIFFSGIYISKAQTFAVDTIQKHADLNHAINFVYLGDGYTATEQSAFINAVEYINTGFFNEAPFSNYKNFFNVFAIKVESLQSGVKHPRTASDCPPSGEFPYANPNNYFGTSFDLYGMHRLTYPSNVYSVFNVAAAHFPMYDQLLVLAHTTQYGGGGGDLATGTEHSASIDLFLHETAHSFAGLADEYWAGEVYATEKANMTNVAYATSNLVKWKDWLGVDGVGIYQHCCGAGSGNWYKPTDYNCQMEALGYAFCPVCKQRIIERIYEMVNPIVSYQPVQTTVNFEETMDFKLTKLLKPLPDTQKIEWILNQDTLAVNQDQITIHPNMLNQGVNSLQAVVIDETELLRVAPSYTNHIHKIIWTITYDQMGVEVESEPIGGYVKLYPNPAVDFINLEIKGLNNISESISLRIYDLTGRVVLEQSETQNNNILQKTLDVSNLAPGLYTLELQTRKIKEAYRIVIAE